MFQKKYLGILNVGHINHYDNHVVHVDGKNNTLICSGLAKNNRFHFACQETTLSNEGVEFDEPSSRALFETLDGFA